MPPARFGRPHPGGDALADQGRLEFGHGADDGEHGPAHRAVGIDLILHADEADAEMVELLERGEQMARAAGEAVELPDQHAVDLAVAGGGHQRVELRPTLLPSGDGGVTIVLDDIEAGTGGVRAQPVILQVRPLVRGRHPQVEGSARSAGRRATPPSSKISLLGHDGATP